jgi:hypothetical protein
MSQLTACYLPVAFGLRAVTCTESARRREQRSINTYVQQLQAVIWEQPHLPTTGAAATGRKKCTRRNRRDNRTRVQQEGCSPIISHLEWPSRRGCPTTRSRGASRFNPVPYPAVFIYTMPRKHTKLQRGHSSKETWYERWKLEIHKDTTQAVYFCHRLKPAENHFTLNGMNIQFVNSVKYLRVISTELHRDCTSSKWSKQIPAEHSL